MTDSLDIWFAREILVYEDSLVRYISRSWHHRDDIHDLRQEVYIRVYEAASQERPRAPKSFLFTTARNLMADRMRRSRVVSIEAKADLESLNVHIDEVSPEDHAVAHDELRTLARAFEQLTPRCREIVWMRRVEDLSQRDVATRLGIAENVVEKQIAKAMRHFTDALLRERGLEPIRVGATAKKQLKQ